MNLQQQEAIAVMKAAMHAVDGLLTSKDIRVLNDFAPNIEWSPHIGGRMSLKEYDRIFEKIRSERRAG